MNRNESGRNRQEQGREDNVRRDYRQDYNRDHGMQDPQRAHGYGADDDDDGRPSARDHDYPQRQRGDDWGRQDNQTPDYYGAGRRSRRSPHYSEDRASYGGQGASPGGYGQQQGRSNRMDPYEGGQTFAQRSDFSHEDYEGGYGNRSYGSGQRIGGMRERQQSYGEDMNEKGREQQEFDADYRRWRNEKMKAFDDDYRNYQNERQSKFGEEFDTFRKNHQKSATTSAGNAGPGAKN